MENQDKLKKIGTTDQPQPSYSTMCIHRREATESITLDVLIKKRGKL